ncbi:MAG TPA: hypothetical protein VHE61_08505 [Opitutaceae bacterium]|nr:hypothetical protein [Opitutaceae bacterium]
MDTDDQLTSDIIAALACLPFEQQAEGMRIAISNALKHMSVLRIEAIRRRIRVELDEHLPAIRTTLDIIDGQLALREIGNGAFWR